MKIHLITKNKHKVQEAISVFSEFNIEIKQLSEEKYEPDDMDLKQIAEQNARYFYEKYKKPVLVDDTGIFFKAYDNFPGNQPKRYFQELGYEGLLKKLEGKNRKAYFKTVVSYCDKFGVKTFEGVLDCVADTKVNDLDVDILPYERILLVDGMPLSQFSREDKNKISHRAIAFRNLAEWLNKRSDNSVKSA